MSYGKAVCVAESILDPIFIVYHPLVEPGFLVVSPKCRAYALVAPVYECGELTVSIGGVEKSCVPLAFEVVDAGASAPRRLVEEGVVLRGSLAGTLLSLMIDEYNVLNGLRICYESGCDASLVQSAAAYVTFKLLERLAESSVGKIDWRELAMRVEKLTFIALYLDVRNIRGDGLEGAKFVEKPPRAGYYIGFTGVESGVARFTVYNVLAWLAEKPEAIHFLL